jgi:hypothetical protein
VKNGFEIIGSMGPVLLQEMYRVKYTYRVLNAVVRTICAYESKAGDLEGWVHKYTKGLAYVLIFLP